MAFAGLYDGPFEAPPMNISSTGSADSTRLAPPKTCDSQNSSTIGTSMSSTSRLLLS